jgi:GrpB-like predicted nucleotidyltransferase (UPF0157 family)
MSTTSGDADVIFLGEGGKYPFFLVQPARELLDVFERHADKIKAALGDDLNFIGRVGSSAIEGMPGTPVVDVLATLRSGSDLSRDDLVDRLTGSCGFVEPPFSSPHSKDDTWFWGGDKDAGVFPAFPTFFHSFVSRPYALCC